MGAINFIFWFDGCPVTEDQMHPYPYFYQIKYNCELQSIYNNHKLFNRNEMKYFMMYTKMKTC